MNGKYYFCTKCKHSHAKKPAHWAGTGMKHHEHGKSEGGFVQEFETITEANKYGWGL